MAVTIIVLGAGQVPGGLVVRAPGRPVRELPPEVPPAPIACSGVGAAISPSIQQLNTVGMRPHVVQRQAVQPEGKVGPDAISV